MPRWGAEWAIWGLDHILLNEFVWVRTRNSRGALLLYVQVCTTFTSTKEGLAALSWWAAEVLASSGHVPLGLPPPVRNKLGSSATLS